MGVAVRSAFASTAESLLDYSYNPKLPSGKLPYAGSPRVGRGPDNGENDPASHMDIDVSMFNYVMYMNHPDFLVVDLSQYSEAMEFFMAITFGVPDPKSAEAAFIPKYLTEGWNPIGPKSPKLLQSISFISSLEIEAHFGAERTDWTFELIRSCWGWHLDNPSRTESTAMEG
ncbi:hypothetical protein DL765_009581 [Monosporascus sp. GIB2]|nr:hypothetical protein DL765_009581 [Monosporascus sp. GIB2]